MIRPILISFLLACTSSPPVAPYRDAAECPPAQSCPVRYPCQGLPCVAIADCTVATPTTPAVCACTVRALVDPLTVATQDVVVECFGP